MEDNIKIVHTKNLNKVNFNFSFNITIDTNANIKNILNIDSYIHEQKCECGSGKAIISGKLGIKVLYVDTDDMTNIVTDSQSFSETYLENSITTDTYLNLGTPIIVNSILSSEGNLKINCDVSFSPIAYLNLPITNNLQPNDTLITKKCEVASSCIKEILNTRFEYSSNLETNDVINKILCSNSYFSAEKYHAENGYITVEGKLTSCVLYETNVNDFLVMKEMRETTSFKYDIELNSLSSDDNLDLSFIVDPSLRDISTEIEENQSVVTIKDTIKLNGVVLKRTTIEVLDDLFSLENEIETSRVSREFTKKAYNHTLSEIISNEIALNNDEPAIDEVIANLNINPEITNAYIKDNNVYIEGIVSSNLTYIDENKELKHKEIQLPFIINTKIHTETLGSIHHQISVVDTRVKVKRGTIIDVEYTLFVNLYIYEKETHEVLDNFNIGKQLDFSKYDFQIFIAKPEESLWELCKRIKISPNEIHKYNKDLPLIMQGGEKVVIKR